MPSDARNAGGRTLTLAEVADYFGVSPETVSSWVSAGELKAMNVARNRSAKRPSWRVTRAALDAFEAARTAAPGPVSRRPRRAKPAEVIEFYA